MGLKSALALFAGAAFAVLTCLGQPAPTPETPSSATTTATTAAARTEPAPTAPASSLANPTAVVRTNTPFPSPARPSAALPPGPAPESITASLIRLLGGLALLAATGFGLVWWIRNGRTRFGGTIPQRQLAILETRSLGQRHTLYVVAHRQKRFLIGTSTNGLSLISPLPDEDPLPPGHEKNSPPADFAELLSRLTSPRS